MKRKTLIGICISLIVLTITVISFFISLEGGTDIEIPSAPETIEEVQQLMQITEECTLPCFWGFVPGEHTVVDVFNFVQPEYELISEQGAFILEYYYSENDIEPPLVSLNFWIEGDRLNMISAVINEPLRILPDNSVGLQNLLMILNSEPEIYIAANSTTLTFSMVIIDDHAGIMVQYILPFQVLSDVLSPTSEAPVLLCPSINQYRTVSLWLQSANLDTPVSVNGELGQRIRSERNSQATGHYLTLEEIVNDEIDIVIEQLIENPDFCIEGLTYQQILELGW